MRCGLAQRNAVVQADQFILVAVDQHQLAGQAAGVVQRGQRITQDAARHPRIELVGQSLHAAVWRDHHGQVGRLAGGAQFGRQAGCQTGAERLAGDHDPLAFVAGRKFGPDRAHVGAQLLLAGNLAAALAKAAVIEHHDVEVQFAKGVEVNEPFFQVAGVAVQEEHHAARVGQLQLGGAQAGARYIDESFVDVGVGGQGLVLRHGVGFEQQTFLAEPEPADGGRVDGSQCQQAAQEEDHISHDAASLPCVG